jgi:hypothetical protein
MAPLIVPGAKSLYLCDHHVGYSNGKVDLYGLFNAIRPADGYPHSRTRFCVFVQMSGGLGTIPIYLDIRFAETEELIWTTELRQLSIPDRHTIAQVALTVEGCRFERPGLYLLELFCNNAWVCDTTLLLR